MNFLLINDDGIEEKGIRILAKTLKDHGKVYVCAPEKQQSGKSHSITLEGPFHIREVDFPGAEKAYVTSGTPSDCTRIGVQFLREMGIEPDIVYSGINLGCNLGADTLYSGTVGAAMEAALMGCHGISVSVNGHHATHFDAACRLAVQAIDHVVHELPTNIVLNINTPDLPAEEIRGVMTARLGESFYRDHFELVQGGEYKLVGLERDQTHLGEDIDVNLNRQHYATVTPLLCDFTEHRLLSLVREWGFRL